MTLDVFHNFEKCWRNPSHAQLNYSFFMRYLKDHFLVRNRNAYILAQIQFLHEGTRLLHRLQIKVLLWLFLGSRCQSVLFFFFLCSLSLYFSLLFFFLVSLFFCRAVIFLLVYTSSSEKTCFDLCPKYNHPGDRILLTRLRSDVHSSMALVVGREVGSHELALIFLPFYLI